MSDLSGKRVAGPIEKRPGDEDVEGSPQTGENICPRCGGAGRVEGAECPVCAGTGFVTEIVGDA